MIQIVTSNLSVTQCYQGLTQGHSRSSGKPAPCVPAGLHFDPRSSALITNGKPGHLQFYSVQKDKQLYNVIIKTYHCATFTQSKNNLDRDLEDEPVYMGHSLFITTMPITFLFIVQSLLHYNSPNVLIKIIQSVIQMEC